MDRGGKISGREGGGGNHPINGSTSPRRRRATRAAVASLESPWIRRPARQRGFITYTWREGAADLLYGVAAPTQTRPARSARALWACCGRPSCPGGGIQRTVRREPAVVRAETSRRARVALLSTQGGSVGHQGGGNARIAFPSPPPNLLLQDSVPAGRAASWAPRQSLRKTHIDSIPP